jgi:hypothetical protein
MTHEEEILRTHFHLGKNQWLEFHLGSLGAGDVLEVTVSSAYEYSQYLLELREGKDEALLCMHIEGGKTFRYRVPRNLSNARLVLKCEWAITSGGFLFKDEGGGELVALLRRHTSSGSPPRSCQKCGAPAEPGARYCWKCGAKLG